MNCNTTHYRANSSSVPGDPTFLACKGGNGEPREGSPQGPDARGGRDDVEKTPPSAPGSASTDSSAPDAGTADAGTTDAGGSSTAMVLDGGHDAGGARAPKVDKREHRKGMPVRDNLLE